MDARMADASLPRRPTEAASSAGDAATPAAVARRSAPAAAGVAAATPAAGASTRSGAAPLDVAAVTTPGAPLPAVGGTIGGSATGGDDDVMPLAGRRPPGDMRAGPTGPTGGTPPVSARIGRLSGPSIGRTRRVTPSVSSCRTCCMPIGGSRVNALTLAPRLVPASRATATVTRTLPITSTCDARRVKPTTRAAAAVDPSWLAISWATVVRSADPDASAAAAWLVRATMAEVTVCLTRYPMATAIAPADRWTPRPLNRPASISRPRKIRTPSVLGLQSSSAAISSRVIPPK